MSSTDESNTVTPIPSSDTTLWTDLHSASRHRDAETVRLLIASGEDVNATDSFGRIPIYYAIQKADIDITQQLLDSGSKISDDPELLYLAVQVECQEILEMLLQRNVDVNAKGPNGRTALHVGAMDWNDDPAKCNNANREPVEIKAGIAKMLIRYGARLEATSNSGLTALHIAAGTYVNNVLQVLIEHGAEVNCQTGHGITPLHIAVHRGNIDGVKILLKHEADVNAEQEDKTTALHIAAETENDKMVDILLEHGANIDGRIIDGITPLHIACMLGKLSVIEILLAHGADVNAFCEKGFTPLGYAFMMSERARMGEEETSEGEDVERIIGEDSDDISVREEIVDVMKLEIRKRIALGLFMCPPNLEALGEDFKSDHLYSECVGEIEKMRQTKIGDSCVSYYNFLMRNIISSSMNIGNKMIELAFRSNEYKEMFPLYSAKIAAKIEIAQRRFQLYNSGLKAIDSIAGFPLTYVVSKKVLNYLDNSDLKALIKVPIGGK